VSCWGSSIFGQTFPPGGLSAVVVVTTAYCHSVAPKADGTIFGHGNPALAQVPSSLSNTVAIAAGAGHNLALKNDGTLVGWAANATILNNIPGNLTDMVAMAGGGEYAGDHDLAPWDE
jgi:hypothetical protein